MSTAKHTPGPWVVILSPADHDEFEVVTSNVSMPICQFWRKGYGVEAHAANARLIAAAPDLLEALMTVIANAPEPYCAITRAIDAKCRAAIARATGEQP